MENLLTPTLSNVSKPEPGPFRLGSMGIHSFLAGPMGWAIVQTLNQPQINTPKSQLRVVWGLALCSTLVVAVVHCLFPAEQRMVRLLGRALGVACFLGTRSSLVARYRLFDLRYQNEDYRSLWLPGSLALLGGIVLHLIVVVPIILAYRGLLG